ncbi:MAG: hypothetical protein KBG63_06955 [Acetobacterium sp.]|nr:hypothetical protein [Acetobacterium sp.]
MCAVGVAESVLADAAKKIQDLGINWGIGGVIQRSRVISVLNRIMR